MRRFGFAALAMAMLAAVPASADPVVVELFTSQGCSSCPPANANLAAIADRPDLLALSFGVTYWDQLGWKDTFAQDKFTRRQYAYARPLGHGGPFTPQIVVNGATDGTGIHRSELNNIIAHAARLDGPGVVTKDNGVTIGAGRPGAEADVWLVRYDTRTVNVPVLAGENRGETLAHRNVVKDLIHLGAWQGPAIHFALPPSLPGLSTAILVQAIHGGPILAAAKI